MDGYLNILEKYADFSGRARRTEYWIFVLFNLIIGIMISVVDYVIGSPGVVGLIFTLAILIPSIAVGERRLHDTSRSGWWLLIAFVPVIGAVVLIILFMLDSNPDDNRFGADPKA